VAIAVTNERPIPLHRRVPGISHALASAVMSCLEKDPAHRPADVRALMGVLQTVHTSLPPPIAEEDLAPTERRSALAVDPGPAISPIPPPPAFGSRPASYVVDEPLPTLPLGLALPAVGAVWVPPQPPRPQGDLVAARRRRALTALLSTALVLVAALAAWWVAANS
jgi:hypothetical protein